MDSIPDISAITPGGDSGSPTKRSRTPFPDVPTRDGAGRGQTTERDATRAGANGASVARTDAQTKPSAESTTPSERNAPIGPDGKPYKGIDLWV